MKITGILFVIMAAVLNMLPFAALSYDNTLDIPKTAVECHCDAMKGMDNKSLSENEKSAYMISCSTSDRQAQERQNHSQLIVSAMQQSVDSVISSYIYPESKYSIPGICLLTDTPPPKSLS